MCSQTVNGPSSDVCSLLVQNVYLVTKERSFRYLPTCHVSWNVTLKNITHSVFSCRQRVENFPNTLAKLHTYNETSFRRQTFVGCHGFSLRRQPFIRPSLMDFPICKYRSFRPSFVTRFKAWRSARSSLNSKFRSMKNSARPSPNFKFHKINAR